LKINKKQKNNNDILLNLKKTNKLAHKVVWPSNLFSRRTLSRAWFFQRSSQSPSSSWRPFWWIHYLFIEGRMDSFFSTL